MPSQPFTVRVARPAEYEALGRLLVASYSALAGMPSPAEQPEYYARLRDVGARAASPAITVLVATDAAGELLGGVDFIDDMIHYASSGVASGVPEAAGIRLLVVAPAARGRGVGSALTKACLDRAGGLGKQRVVLHTTKAMETAWRMYERLGFVHDPALDFQQGRLAVFGFQRPVII